MPRALNLLRSSLHYRRSAFDEGLCAAGFKLCQKIDRPEPGDVVVLWNRYGAGQDHALHFERHGARAIVVENGYLGKDWNGGEWFSVALDHHAGAGAWFDGGPERWDRLNVQLAPWRLNGNEVVVFGQRGIGESSVRCPEHWTDQVMRLTRGRLRPHPGKDKDRASKPLELDLAKASSVVTWNSGAALKALLWGIPVWCDWAEWIGASACRPFSQWATVEPLRNDEARLKMFRRAAWAQWTLNEVRAGEPFVLLREKMLGAEAVA